MSHTATQTTIAATDGPRRTVENSPSVPTITYRTASVDGLKLFYREAAAAASCGVQNDPFFLPAGAQAFKRDNPDAEVRLLDAGHFALESRGPEIAAIIRDFLAREKARPV